MSFSPRGGGKGGKGGGRSGGKGGGKGKGGKGGFEEGPPDRVEVVGIYMHECEGEMVCKLANDVSGNNYGHCHLFIL
jgi:H/ACA ribonucleoprotein complex subunit 1